jgi:integrase
MASLRWGEATALRRCDLYLNARMVTIRAAYVERSTGEMLLGPAKSRAARRIVGVPEVIIPTLREHLAAFADDDPGALVFPGAKGGPDLRHTGNHFAAQIGAALRDLMARMGHDSDRAAMIDQHKAQGADKAITSPIDPHVQAGQAKRDDGPSDVMAPAG